MAHARGLAGAEDELQHAPYNPALMRRLLTYARPHALTLAACVLLLLLVTVLQLTQPYLIKLAIDRILVVSHGPKPSLWGLALTYLGVATVGSAISYANGLLITGTGQRIIQRIRQDVFEHLLSLGLAFFDHNPVGRLVTRVTNDTEALSEMYTSVLVILFRDVFVIAGTIVVMLELDGRLALVGFAVMPLVALTTVTVQNLLFGIFRVARVRLARINATLAENFSGMRVIQVFNRQDRQLAEFEDTNDAYFQASWSQLRIAAVSRPLLDLLSQVALAATLWVGGLEAMHHAVELGTLYVFTSYLRQLYNPISELAEKFNIMQSAMASSERIFQLLDTTASIVDGPQAVSAGPGLQPDRESAVRGQVEFQNVWFAYDDPADSPEPNWVLKDVSFVAQPGQTVAIVGHTGAGKSSIMNLVARFYDAQRGDVLVNGIDVRQLKQADLRETLGTVLQEPFLFTGTIEENILLWGTAPEQTAAAPRDAQAFLREAGGSDLLEGLPAGLATEVTERGASLSTGERQLVAFARALATKPAILILDEATASVDSRTEAILQQALERRAGAMTTLIVAHRLSTVQKADQILVLHKGRIREVGTHQELLDAGGIYRKLWDLQTASQAVEVAAAGHPHTSRPLDDAGVA